MTYLIDIRLANNFFCFICLLFSEWASFLFGEYVINVCILSGNSGKVHCSAHLFAHYSVYRFVKVFGRERRRVWIHKSIISYSIYFVFFSSEMVAQFFLDT